MKLATLSLLTLALVSIQGGCKKDKATAGTCYKGRLEVKAMCMNYTIAIIDGPVDTSLVENNWRDESSGRTYQNVFGLRSVCTFPATIAEGDEFYFTIDNSAAQNCAVCMAYYPTPAKKLSIRVLSAPCNP